MSNLSVCDRGGILVIDSRLIAEDLGIEHKALLQTIGKYEIQIQEAFGTVPFEMEGSNGLPGYARFALLTEDQATFVATLSRNTDRVVAFKIRLVQAFSEAKKQLQPQLTQIQILAAAAAQLATLEQKQIESDRRIAATEQQLKEWNSIRAIAHADLIALPPSSQDIPQESTDMKIRRVVNNYCAATGMQQGEVFRNLYQQFYYRFRRRVTPAEKESKLQAFIRLGLIDALYELAIELFSQAA